MIQENKKALIKGENKKIDFSNQIINLITQNFLKNPDTISVFNYEEKISNKELNIFSNKIGNLLVALGVKKGTKISVMLERGKKHISTFLGILKIGGVYVPIDPNYPLERKKYVLEDSESQILITTCDNLELIEYLSMSNIKIILLDKFEEDKKINFKCYSLRDIENQKEEIIPIKKSLSDIAYILYTSGSTGKPKGVMVSQRGILHKILCMHEYFKTTGDDVIIHKTTISFSDSIAEILWALAFNFKIAIISERDSKEPKKIYELLLKYKGSIVQFVPSQLKLFIDTLKNIKNIKNEQLLPQLRYIISSGEPLTVPLVKSWYEVFPDIDIYNIYGMTETVSYSTIYKTNKKTIDKMLRIPIGAPLPGTKVYILDKDFRVCNYNEKGEIYIGGEGLSLGYLNKEELTKKLLIELEESNEILCKTGDLGKVNDEEEIEYYGRIDNMVKIRGMRIELEEIENALLSHKDITEVIISVVENEFLDKYLVAFYTTKREIEALDLREYLKNKIPEYMVPPRMIQIKKIPLLPNGKTDKKQIFQFLETNDKNKNIILKNNEKILSSILNKLLGIRSLGIDDDIFNFGVTSVTIARTQIFLEELGLFIKYADFFEYRTIKKISEYIKKRDEESKMEVLDGEY